MMLFLVSSLFKEVINNKLHSTYCCCHIYIYIYIYMRIVWYVRTPIVRGGTISKRIIMNERLACTSRREVNQFSFIISCLALTIRCLFPIVLLWSFCFKYMLEILLISYKINTSFNFKDEGVVLLLTLYCIYGRNS